MRNDLKEEMKERFKFGHDCNSWREVIEAARDEELLIRLQNSRVTFVGKCLDVRLSDLCVNRDDFFVVGRYTCVWTDGSCFSGPHAGIGVWFSWNHEA